MYCVFVSVCAREVAWIIGIAETFSMFFQYSIHVKLVWRKMIFQHFSIIFFLFVAVSFSSPRRCSRLWRSTRRPTMTTIIIESKTKCNGIMSVRPKTIKFNYSCEFLHGWDRDLILARKIRWTLWYVSVCCAFGVRYVNARRKSQQMDKKALTMSLWNMVYAAVTIVTSPSLYLYRIKKFSQYLHNSFACNTFLTFCVCFFFFSYQSINDWNCSSQFPLSIHSNPFSVSLAQSLFRWRMYRITGSLLIADSCSASVAVPDVLTVAVAIVWPIQTVCIEFSILLNHKK